VVVTPHLLCWPPGHLLHLALHVLPVLLAITIPPVSVATELPNTVTDPDVAERINQLHAKVAIPADSFARAVVYTMSQAEDVDANEILFRVTRQAY
jgi:NADP-dependent 3-hydroxy acid dehydrogenase YdfG